MIFQLSDWFPKPMIWAIIVTFDQIRKNWWRISCAEILEVGKNFFAASSVKKMSRFEEVSPEEIKRIVNNATPINTKRSTKYGLKIFIGKCVLNAIKYLQSSANSTAFIARGGQIFPRPQYNFSRTGRSGCEFGRCSCWNCTAVVGRSVHHLRWTLCCLHWTVSCL